MRQRLIRPAGVAAISALVFLAMHTVAGQSSTTPRKASALGGK